LREVLGDGALIIEQYDAAEWAAAARELLNNKEKHQTLADRGR
jgi:hypothetical protein